MSNACRECRSISLRIFTLLVVAGFPWPCAMASVGEGLTESLLDESLRLGTRFLLTQQKPEGNFNYQINLVTGELAGGESQVRQAGALWALSLIYRRNPEPEIQSAIERGLAFFEKHSESSSSGDKFIAYPGARVGDTGTLALVSLAIIDYIRGRTDEVVETRWRPLLDDYLLYLASLRTEEGLFLSSYDLQNGRGLGSPSPYFDGECLLAWTKAWRHMGYLDLEGKVWESAGAMHRDHVELALQNDPDSSETKGYFLWGCLSYHELFEADSEFSEEFGRRALDLANWMIDVHETLERTKNTAYAQEGILVSLKMARELGEEGLARKFQRVIEEGLFKLTTWQVGVSVQNDYLKSVSPVPEVVGGVMNSRKDPKLRVDVTQHQMHAVMLAREILYADRSID
ncbi:MAG: hypothetical protein KC994_01140 [Candidatus Omnitrophica bacterium]|nr:hypothetical protein [Candidatus Omnitrophota bacterium]